MKETSLYIHIPFCKYSSPPIAKNSSISESRYTSKWYIGVLLLYSFTIVKVGLDISFSRPK